jgi:hypothetical protein
MEAKDSSKDGKLTLSTYAEWAPLARTKLESESLAHLIKYDSFRDYRREVLIYPTMMKEYDDYLQQIDKDHSLSAEEKKKIKREIDRDYLPDRRKYEDSVDKAEAKWIEDDIKVRAKLKLNVEYVIQQEIEGIETAYLMWKKLAEYGRSIQTHQQFELIDAYTNCHYDQKESIVHYIKRVQECHKKLEGTSHSAVTEFFSCRKILNNIPQEQHQTSLQLMKQLKPGEITFKKVSSYFSSTTPTEQPKQTQVEANQTQISKRKKCQTCKVKTVSERAPKDATQCSGCYLTDHPERRRERTEKINNTETIQAHNTEVNAEHAPVKTKEKEKEESSEESYELVICHNVENNGSKRAKESQSKRKGPYYFDSGCTANLTNDPESLINPKKSNTQIVGPLTSEKSSHATLEGEVQLSVTNNNTNKQSTITLKKVICDENLRRKLLSVKKLTAEGLSVLFVEDKVLVVKNLPSYSNDDVLLAGAIDETGLYALSDTIGGTILSNCATTNSQPLTLKEWHTRLCHMPISRIIEMIERKQIDKNKVKRVEGDTEEICECCALAKMRRSVFAQTRSVDPAAQVGDAIHSDVCGPIDPPSLGKNNYFITYIDEKSDYTMVVTVPNKSNNFAAFKLARKFVKTQTGKKVKKLVCDGGGEYISGEMRVYLEEKGIIQQLTPADTPQLNGKSERVNLTLMNTVRAMLLGQQLPLEFWGEALRYANFQRNRTNRKKEKRTRYENFFNKKPAPYKPHTFGCFVTFKDNSKKKKLDNRGKRGIFVGLSEEDGTFRIYDALRGDVVKSRDVTFYEGIPIPDDFFDEERETKKVP